MEQNSQEWLEWRKKGIGGSDAPIILDISPWKTPYELWEEKTGVVKPDEDDNTFITEKGHRLEPKARALYEIDHGGHDFPPALVERQDRPHHRASLDGRNVSLKKTLEIKYVGAGEKWEMALNDEVPDYYMAQMQWQLYVTGDESVDYVAYNEKENKIKVITVLPDVKFIAKMVKAVDKFWEKVENKKEPKLSDRDYKRVSSREMKDAIDKYVEIKKEMKELEVKLKEQETIIKEHPRFNHRRMAHGDVKLMIKTRKGSVDFKKIVTEKLPDFDTSNYIKPSTTYKEIKV